MNRISRLRSKAFLFVAATSLSTAVAGQALEPFDFGVSAEQRFDSNLFRLRDGVEPGGSGDRSVFSQYVTASAHLDKTYGLQRVALDASISRDFYDGYRNLDYTGNKVGLTYKWSITPSISGDVILQHSNLPTDFAYTGYLTRPNPTKSDVRRLDVDWRPGSALHPRLSVVEVEDRTAMPLFQQQNVRSTATEVSLVYEFRSGNTAELYVRRAPGSYVGQFDQNAAMLTDPDFTEREVGVRAKWSFTGASKLEAAFGYLDQTHRTYAVRDFNGLVGSVDYVYTFSGKSSLQVSAGRSLASAQTLFSSYVVDDALAVSPVYAATGKLTVRPSVSIVRRTFRNAPFPVAADLRYVSRAGSLAVDYAALRALDISLALIATNRNANDTNYQYRDRTALVTGRFKF